MAAEPVGSAYVVIRAVTTRLAKDIQDGLDKGAKDAKTDEAGRDIGDRVGEASGESFGDSFDEHSSRRMEESADSRDMKRGQQSFIDKIFGRFREGFDRESGGLGESIGNRMTAGLERGTRNVDVDRAAGTLGSDMGDEVGDDFDVSFNRRMEHTFTRNGNNDKLSTGASGIGMRLGKSIADGASRSFTDGIIGFGDSIAGALSSIKIPGGSFAVLAQLAIPALGGALQTVGALIGSTTAVLGFLGTAAVGATVAFAGLGAAVAPAFLLIKGALSADSDELDHFHDRMEKFSEDWKEVALATQELLLPALEASIDNLTTLIPLFKSYGTTIGRVVGDIAFGVTSALTEPENQARINSILIRGADIIQTLGDAAVSFVTPLLTILDAAMPLAQRLADAILRGSDAFADWIEKADKSGALTAMFDKWYDRFALIGSILGNLGGAMADIFGIGADSVDGMFKSLEGITQRWSDWTNSGPGQEKLMTFFENARRISGELFGVIGDIGKQLFGGMFKPDGVDGLIGFFREIRDVWIPTISEFAQTLKDALGPQVSAFFEAFTNLLQTLADNPEITAGIFNVLISNFLLFTEALKILSAVINSDIAKNFGPLILKIVLFAKFAAALWPLLKLVILGFRGFASILGAIFSPIGLVVAAIAAVVGGIALLYFHFQPFRDFVDRNIIDPLQRLWASIQQVGGLFALFKTLPALLRILWDSLPTVDFKKLFQDPLGTLSGLAHDVADALRNTFAGIPLFSQLANGLAAAFDFIGDSLKNLKKLFKDPFKGATKILTFFSELGEKLAEFAGKGLDLLIKNLPKMGSILGKAFGILVKVMIAGLGVLLTSLASLFATLLPTLLEIFKRLPQLLLAALKGIGNFVVAFLNELGLIEAFQKYFPIVIGYLVDFFTALPGMLLGLIKTFGPMLGRGLLELAKFMGEALLAGLALLPGILLAGLGLLVAGLGELVSLGAKLAGAIWNGIKNFFTETLPQIASNFITWVGDIAADLPGFGRKIGGFIWDGLSTFLTETLPRIVSQFITWVGDIGSSILGFGKSIGGKIWDGLTLFLTDILPTLLSKLPGWIGTAWEALGDFGRSAGGKIWDGLSLFLTEILPTILTKIGGWIGTGWEALGDFGRTAGGKIWDGLSLFLTEVLPRILSQFATWVGAVGQSIWNLGRSIAGRIWDGLTVFLTEILPTLLTKLPGWIGAVGQSIWNFGRSVGGRIWDGLSVFLSDTLPRIISQFASWVGGVGQTIWNFGRSVAGKIWDGLSNVFKEYIVGLPGKIVDWAMSSLIDLAQLGWDIADKIAGGILDFFTNNPISDFVTGLFGGEGGSPFDWLVPGLTNGATTESLTRAINSVITDSFAGVEISPSETQQIVDKIFAAVAAGDPPTGAEIEAIIEEVTGEALTNAEPSPNDVAGFMGNVGTALAGADWSKAGKAAADGFKKSAAPGMVSGMKEGVDQEFKSSPFSIPLPNLDDDIGVVRGWAGESATTIRKSLNTEIKKTKKSEFKAPAQSLIDSLEDGLQRSQKSLRPFSVGLVVQIISWIQTTVKLMQTMGVAMMAALLQGLTVGFLLVGVFMRTVPTRMVTAMGNVAATFTPAGLALMGGFVKGIQAGTIIAIALVSGLRSRMVSAVGYLGSALQSQGSALMQGLISGVRVGIAALTITLGNIRSTVQNSVGNLGKLLYASGQSIVEGLINGIRSMLPSLRAAAQEARNVAASAKSGGFQKFAMGGIVDGPLIAQIGEAGREVVIPLTRPLRALSLLHASGLDQLVRQGSPTGGDVTLLNIEHADINDKVDVDMVAARLHSAYRAMITDNGRPA